MMNWMSRMALYMVNLVSPALADKIMEDTVSSQLTGQPGGAIVVGAIKMAGPTEFDDLVETFSSSFIEGVEEANNIPVSLRPRAKAAAKRALSRALGKEAA